MQTGMDFLIAAGLISIPALLFTVEICSGVFREPEHLMKALQKTKRASQDRDREQRPGRIGYWALVETAAKLQENLREVSAEA